MSLSHIIRVAHILRDAFIPKGLKVTPYEVDNLLDDPSFESGRFVDWHITNGTADIDWKVYHVSGKSAKATGIATKTSLLERTHFLKGKGGMIAVLAGWYRADGNVTLYKPRISVFDEKGAWLKNLAGDDLIVLYGAPFDWRFYRMCRVLPDETGLIQITFEFTSGGVAGNVWLDDLYVAIVPLTNDNILKFGTKIMRYKYVTNGTDTFYEVGADLVAFLVSAQLMIEHAGAGAHSGSLRRMPDDINLLLLEHPDAVDFSSEAQQWSPPFKLLSGEGIRVQANAPTTSHACIQGYEIK